MRLSPQAQALLDNISKRPAPRRMSPGMISLCDRKTKYPTPEAARDAMLQTQAATPDDPRSKRPAVVWKCKKGDGNHWHWGHKY